MSSPVLSSKQRRQQYGRQLAFNAATHPWPLALGAVVAVASILSGVLFGVFVALLAYVGVAVTMFFDDAQGQKVLERMRAQRENASSVKALPESLQKHVVEARAQRDAVISALQDSADPMPQVQAEIRALTAEVDRVATAGAPAVRFYENRHGPITRASNRRQLDNGDILAQRVNDLIHVLTNAVEQIGVLGGEAVAATLQAHGEDQRQLARRVAGLRDDLQATRAGLDVAYRKES